MEDLLKNFCRQHVVQVWQALPELIHFVFWSFYASILTTFVGCAIENIWVIPWNMFNFCICGTTVCHFRPHATLILSGLSSAFALLPMIFNWAPSSHTYPTMLQQEHNNNLKLWPMPRTNPKFQKLAKLVSETTVKKNQRHVGRIHWIAENGLEDCGDAAFWIQTRFLAALAALYLTLVSQSVSQSVTATLEFWHKEWFLIL